MWKIRSPTLRPTFLGFVSMAHDIICQATHEIRHVQLFCQPTQLYNKTQTCQLPTLKIEVKTGKNMLPTAETESATSRTTFSVLSLHQVPSITPTPSGNGGAVLVRARGKCGFLTGPHNSAWPPRAGNLEPKLCLTACATHAHS